MFVILDFLNKKTIKRTITFMAKRGGFFGDLFKRSEPTTHEAFYHKGRRYFDKGEDDKAIECYLKAIEIKPNFSDAFNELGIIYQKRAEFNLAIKYFQKSLSVNPDNYWVYDQLGNIYLSLIHI